MPLSPAVAQLELAVRIRERRRQFRMTTTEVAEYLDFTRNYLSGVENGRAVLAVDKLERLSTLFEFDDRESAEIIKLHEATKEPHWVAEYTDLLPEGVPQFFGLEAGAKRIRNYEGLLIPGLLQTKEYAEAVIGADASTSPATMTRRWELRLRRQRRLTSDEPLQLTALVSEGALMQHFGDGHVLGRQLRHLTTTIESLSETVVVRVLPFDKSPLGLTGASTIMLLEFDSPHLPTMAWREAVTPIGLSNDATEVETLRVSFQQALDTSSLGRQESLELIEAKIAAIG